MIRTIIERLFAGAVILGMLAIVIGALSIIFSPVGVSIFIACLLVYLLAK